MNDIEGKHFKILVVDNNTSNIGLLEKELEKGNISFSLQAVDSKPTLIEKLKNGKVIWNKQMMC